MRKVIVLFLVLFGIASTQAQNIVFDSYFNQGDGLLEREIKDLTRGHTGEFWLLYNSGIQSFDGQTFRALALPKDLDCQDVDKLFSLNDGTICFFYENEVYIIDPARRKIKKTFSKEGHLIVYNEELIEVKYDENNQVFFNSQKKLSYNYSVFGKIKKIRRIGDQYFVLTDKNKLVSLFDDYCEVFRSDVQDIVTEFTHSIWLRLQDSSSISIDKNGLVKKLSKIPKKGCFVYKDSKKNQIVASRRTGYHVKDLMLYDSLGNLTKNLYNLLEVNKTFTCFYSENFQDQVLAGGHMGLYYFNFSRRANMYDVNKDKRVNTLGNIVTYTFFRKRDTTHYYVGMKKGIHKIKNSKTQPVFEKTLKKESGYSLYNQIYDEKTDKLFGVKYKKRTFFLHVLDFSNGLTQQQKLDFRVRHVLVEEDHVILLGGKDGKGILEIKDKSSLETLCKKVFEHTLFDVTQINGKTYFATQNGMLVYAHNGSLCSIDPEMRKEIFFEGYLTVNLLAHKNHLVSTVSNLGVSILDSRDSLILQINERNGLPNPNPSALCSDRDNNIWVGTFNGVVKLDSQYNCVDFYSKSDGLYNTEITGFVINSDPAGNILAGTSNGVAIIDGKQKGTFKPTVLSLESVTYYEKNRMTSTNIGSNEMFRIPYHADSVKIKLKQAGYPMESLRRSYLNNLVSVKSSNSSDMFSRQEDGVVARIEQPGLRSIEIFSPGVFNAFQVVLEKDNFIQKYKWHLVAAIASILLILVALFAIRNHIAHTVERTKSTYDARLSQVKLQALQSQMNPHFIFNALGSIQYYIQTHKMEEADEYLADFAKLMRLILESSKQDFISLRKEIDLLKLYVKLELLRLDDDVESTFFVAPNIDLDQLIPPMLIQPHVENSFLYGLSQLRNRTKKLHIKIQRVESNVIEVCIVDNGVGREITMAKKNKNRKSRGMELIKDRIKSINSQGKMHLTMKINDLYQNEIPMGTEVIYRIRLLTKQ